MPSADKASSRLCSKIDDAVVARQEVLCRPRHLFVPTHHGCVILHRCNLLPRCYSAYRWRPPGLDIFCVCWCVCLTLCNLQLPSRGCICVCGRSGELIDAIRGCPFGSISVGTAFAPVLREAFVLALAVGTFFSTSLGCPHAFTPSFTCITIVI